EVFDGAGSLINRRVKAIKLLQKCVTAEGLRSERVNYLFNFRRDYVAPGEVRIVKDSAKDALSQKMLDEHLFDCFFRKVGINRLPAQREEVIEGRTKAWVGLFLALDYVLKSLSQFRN